MKFQGVPQSNKAGTAEYPPVSTIVVVFPTALGNAVPMMFCDSKSQQHQAYTLQPSRKA
jgi:hypothetical protein